LTASNEPKSDRKDRKSQNQKEPGCAFEEKSEQAQDNQDRGKVDQSTGYEPIQVKQDQAIQDQGNRDGEFGKVLGQEQKEDDPSDKGRDQKIESFFEADGHFASSSQHIGGNHRDQENHNRQAKQKDFKKVDRHHVCTRFSIEILMDELPGQKDSEQGIDTGVNKNL
jgi:hypothetical protein